MAGKIKAQYIGGDLNVTNLADQAVAHLKGLNCWHEFASGKASCGRKSSLRGIQKILKASGFRDDYIRDFLSAVIVRVRMEQRAERVTLG